MLNHLNSSLNAWNDRVVNSRPSSCKIQKLEAFLQPCHSTQKRIILAGLAALYLVSPYPQRTWCTVFRYTNITAVFLYCSQYFRIYPETTSIHYHKSQLCNAYHQLWGHLSPRQTLGAQRCRAQAGRTRIST